MGDNNQENLQNNVQPEENVVEPVEETQDPRLIHPIVIGELRKEKIGKPIMIIELFLLFGIVFAGLPFINNMMNDENSMLYRLLHPDAVIDTEVVVADPGEEKQEFLDGTELNLLAADSKIRFKNVVMKNFSLSQGSITCTMYSYTGTTNLDEEEFYLEISSSSGSVLTAVKLTGFIDNVEKEVTLDAYGIQFNSTLSYQGKFVEMGKDDYPKFDITSVDERGFGSVICSKDNRKITYGFQNGHLIIINDEDTVNNSSVSSDEYINLLAAANKKKDKLGISVATVEENENGYIFRANIDLASGYVVSKEVVDYNYYPIETRVEKIAYAQKGKGFDCR